MKQSSSNHIVGMSSLWFGVIMTSLSITISTGAPLNISSLPLETQPLNETNSSNASVNSTITENEAEIGFDDVSNEQQTINYFTNLFDAPDNGSDASETTAIMRMMQAEVREVGQYSDQEFSDYLLFRQQIKEVAQSTFLPQNLGVNPPAKLQFTGGEIKNTSVLLWEGDIVLTPEQWDRILRSTLQQYVAEDDPTIQQLGKKAALTSNRFARWSFPINYNYDMSSGIDVLAAERGIAIWEQLTCIEFQRNDRPSSRTPYLQFTQGNGCYSGVGRVGGKQSISLGISCTSSLGTPAHEIGHALGLWHEQSRPDRDDYVKILYQNLQPGLESNFMRQLDKDSELYDMPYDLGSVMHYGSQAFTKNGRSLTIQTLDPNYQQTPGQRDGLSFYDVAIMNRAYCNDRCQNKLPCQFNGYTDPKDCNKCRCPDGLSGRLCDAGKRTTSDCGDNPDVVVTSQWQTLSTKGRLQCNYLLKAPRNTVILLDVKKVAFECHTTCNTFVELRYTDDIANTGARLCCDLPKSVIRSETNFALILYRTSRSQHSFSLRYKYEGTPVGPTPGTPTTTRRPTTTTTTEEPEVEITTEEPEEETTTPRPRTTRPPLPTTTTTELITAPTGGGGGPDSGGWSAWSTFSKCSKPCGACGLQYSRRFCLTEACSGDSYQVIRCNFNVCPLDSTEQDVKPAGIKWTPRNDKAAVAAKNAKANLDQHKVTTLLCCKPYIPDENFDQCVRQ